jgi:hypothetical protein
MEGARRWLFEGRFRVSEDVGLRGTVGRDEEEEEGVGTSFVVMVDEGRLAGLGCFRARTGGERGK